MGLPCLSPTLPWLWSWWLDFPSCLTVQPWVIARNLISSHFYNSMRLPCKKSLVWLHYKTLAEFKSQRPRDRWSEASSCPVTYLCKSNLASISVIFIVWKCLQGPDSWWVRICLTKNGKSRDRPNGSAGKGTCSQVPWPEFNPRTCMMGEENDS